MKEATKIIIILLFVCSVSNAQKWNFSFDLSDIATDSVFQTNNLVGIAGKNYTISFDIANADTIFTVDVGGSLFESDETNHVNEFQSLKLRFMPFDIFPNISRDYATFHGDDFQFLKMLIKVSNPAGATGVINCKVIFY